jgi:hypothetical protein
MAILTRQAGTIFKKITNVYYKNSLLKHILFVKAFIKSYAAKPLQFQYYRIFK